MAKRTTARLRNNGDVSLAHNQRDKALIEKENAKNPNRRIAKDGVHEVWSKDRNLREAYEEIFGEALAEYNAKQKRSDRRMTIDEYIQSVESDTRGRKKTKLQKGKRVVDENVTQGKKTCYEIVYSIGNVAPEKDSKGHIKRDKNGARVCPHKIPDDINRAIQKEYYVSFEERNPNFKILRADYHADEQFFDKQTKSWEWGVSHTHLSYIPIGTGYKRGLSKQCSIGKALKEMGFEDGYVTDEATGKQKWVCAYDLWQEREREYLAKLCHKYGYEIDRPYKDKNKETLSTEAYQCLKDYENALEEREAELSKDRKKLENDEALLHIRQKTFDKQKEKYHVEQSLDNVLNGAITKQDTSKGDIEMQKRKNKATNRDSRDLRTQLEKDKLREETRVRRLRQLNQLSVIQSMRLNSRSAEDDFEF